MGKAELACASRRHAWMSSVGRRRDAAALAAQARGARPARSANAGEVGSRGSRAHLPGERDGEAWKRVSYREALALARASAAAFSSAASTRRGRLAILSDNSLRPRASRARRDARRRSRGADLGPPTR